ncbi:hypothetical protein T459_17150 [Capsicum annuum]|uniref:RNase H type-1 domain-containing protein n=1 Tax=Capsicum annuum TaxID=4072 RepID=A0A2G2ZAS2_CAPAN|nr:hypothetical protein T459_17150 [Capsicum annuum]
MRPTLLTVKLNSDESCVHDICGGGYIVRDDQGRFISATSIPIGPVTSNIVKAVALLEGIKWCINRGLRLSIYEIDSLLVTKCIRREWKIP